MNRLRGVWLRVGESLWALPSAITVVFGLLAVGMVWLDQLLGARGLLEPIALAAGTEGARGVLTTIAGSLITVTGVVFSITIVALQLASSQYTPRVLRSFRADRANQVVLGVFIGTFTYALIVLGAVRSEAQDAERFVPVLAVLLALALSLVSVGFLIFFIHHIARSIQAEAIIDRVTDEALVVVDHLFPEEVGKPAGEPGGPGADDRWRGAPVVRAARGGYLQEIREDTILSAAVDADVTVRMEKRIGEFVLPGETLASVAPGDPGESCVRVLVSAFVIGAERTNHQDVERGIIELTDIAVRALSPGIHDPTTALVCIDRLTQVLDALGSRRFPDPHRLGPDGRVRLIARGSSFGHTVLLAFAQLRHHGADNPVIAARLDRSLRHLAARLPENRLGEVRAELDELTRAVERSIASDVDRARVLSAGSGPSSY